jgi:hypothetical protein
MRIERPSFKAMIKQIINPDEVRRLDQLWKQKMQMQALTERHPDKDRIQDDMEYLTTPNKSGVAQIPSMGNGPDYETAYKKAVHPDARTTVFLSIQRMKND